MAGGCISASTAAQKGDDEEKGEKSKRTDGNFKEPHFVDTTAARDCLSNSSLLAGGGSKESLVKVDDAAKDGHGEDAEHVLGKFTLLTNITISLRIALSVTIVAPAIVPKTVAFAAAAQAMLTPSKKSCFTV